MFVYYCQIFLHISATSQHLQSYAAMQGYQRNQYDILYLCSMLYGNKP